MCQVSQSCLSNKHYAIYIENSTVAENNCQLSISFQFSFFFLNKDIPPKPLIIAM